MALQPAKKSETKRYITIFSCYASGDEWSVLSEKIEHLIVNKLIIYSFSAIRYVYNLRLRLIIENECCHAQRKFQLSVLNFSWKSSLRDFLNVGSHIYQHRRTPLPIQLNSMLKIGQLSKTSNTFYGTGCFGIFVKFSSNFLAWHFHTGQFRQY